jgi:integrase
MEIYKRPDSPYWFVDLVHPVTGKRRRVSTRQKLKAAASKAAADMLRELEAEAGEAKDGKRAVTLREALDAYVTTIGSQGKTSVVHYRGLRDKMLGLRPPFNTRWHLDGGRMLHSLEPIDLETLNQKRRAEGNGAQTIAHELKLLRATARYAVGLGWRAPSLLTDGLTKDPWRMPTLTQKTRYLTPEEFNAVFKFLDPDRLVFGMRGGKESQGYRLTGLRHSGRQDAQDLLVALAMTGGRWAEVAQLQWRQVDFEAGTVMLWGNKGKKERMVPMPPPARKVLERRRAKAPAKAIYIFPGRGSDGDEARKDGSCRAILHAMEECGLNRPDLVAKHGRCVVHSLRHTFASWALQGGADLREVQETLGHTTLQMTTRYSHLNAAKTATKLNGIMGAQLIDHIDPVNAEAKKPAMDGGSDGSLLQREGALCG